MWEYGPASEKTKPNADLKKRCSAVGTEGYVP